MKLLFKGLMESNTKGAQRQKITLALYTLKENDNKDLVNKWTIFTGRKYIIGRGKECDINIDNLLLSRQHLELAYYTNNLISVKDLDSRNGTYINNVKINPNQEIKFTTKDKLSLGHTNNKVEFQENNENKESIFENKITNEVSTEKISQNQNKNKNTEERGNDFNNNKNNRFHSYTRNNNNNIKSKNNKTYSTYGKEEKENNLNVEAMIKLLKSKSPLSFPNKKRYKDEFIGRKLKRNENNLEEIEKLKKNLKDNNKNYDDNEEDEDENEEEIEFEEMYDDDNFELEEEKGKKNDKIILKTNKLNKLEFILPVKEKNLKKLKYVKKVKYLVNGYVVLNVKKKKLIFE